MKIFNTLLILVMSMLTFSCGQKTEPQEEPKQETTEFKFQIDKFGDLKIMRYQVPGFDELRPEQKELIYYLSQAALCGRDIIFDQNSKHNLAIRRTCEAIYENYSGDKETEDFNKFVVYMKRVWFSNGIHHHYSTEKFIPEFSKEYFAELISNTDAAKLPLQEGETAQMLIEKLTPVMYDHNVYAKRVNLNTEVDIIENSANNYYEGVTEEEAEQFYAAMKDPKDETPLSYGLNSKLTKIDGKVVEKVWKVGGMYSEAIEKIVYWLEKAIPVAEDENQKASITKLVEYLKSGDLNTWDEYNVLWVQDLEAQVDFVNGFIETYGDAFGIKASFESVVNFKDIEATKRATTISSNAQWFEDNSPVDPRFKKKEVRGVTAKVITVAQLGGDCYPSTPIGINLPNANWIRKDHGSKSVTIENITYAYNQASLGNGFTEEFSFTPEEIELSKKHSSLAGNLHTDLHECLGHGSGQMLPGVGDDALKSYHSTLEEARADLFALYYMLDDKMVELGLMPTLDVAKAEYNTYIRNGLMTQLTRVELGKEIEESHMRNRQLIAQWCYEKGKEENVISKETKDGKTYIVVNDHQKLRDLFGELLIEMQRIKSEGDYEAGKEIVEKYAVKVDYDLHKEVLDRYKTLNLAPYGGFINPVFVPVMEGEKIIDVKVEYPDNYTEQMMKYAKEFSFLPTYN